VYHLATGGQLHLDLRHSLSRNFEWPHAAASTLTRLLRLGGRRCRFSTSPVIDSKRTSHAQGGPYEAGGTVVPPCAGHAPMAEIRCDGSCGEELGRSG
jgi:hypothetical protein